MQKPRPRKPRFTRSPSAAQITLTDRDIAILSLVNRYRFIQSHHVAMLHGGSRQHIVRRLGRLYHGGFLERPRSQLYLIARTPKTFAYCLTQASLQILRQRSIPTFASPPRPSDSQTALSLSHALRVTDIISGIEASAAASGVSFISHHQWQLPAARHHSDKLGQLRWNITGSNNANRTETTVIPDSAFALRAPGEVLAFFAVEVDRGTMPVARADSAQTSFIRKVIAYKETRRAGILWKRFQIPGFRVLVIAESMKRLASLQAATASAFPNGESTMFLFTVAASLLSDPDPLSHVWKTCSGNTIRLLGE